jgi:hypothetical protein
MQTALVGGGVGRVAIELVQLPEEDVSLVAEFIKYLKGQRQPITARRAPAAQLVAEARQQAYALQDVPRAEIAAQFATLVETIRGQAIAHGTAIEGNWLGD